MLNKTHSLRPHCVSCWTAYIYYKMIHGPYSVKITEFFLENELHWQFGLEKKNTTNSDFGLYIYVQIKRHSADDCQL